MWNTTHVFHIRKAESSNTFNDVWFHHFVRNYKPKQNQPILSIFLMDNSALPPCLKTAKMKILRADFITGMWLSSYKICPPPKRLQLYCWKLSKDECRYEISWFEVAMVPQNINDVTVKQIEENNDDYQDQMQYNSEDDEKECE